jgi:lipoyl(octanoyl) transferase
VREDPRQAGGYVSHRKPTVTVLRLLPFAVADGPGNMGADEALLDSAAAGTATLRFYGWTTATISLGYFQEAERLRDDPRLAGLPYVRRPSGGEALVHDREVTYALALPPGPPWQTRGESWARRFHLLLRDALAPLGVRTELCPPDGEKRLGDFLCFRHHTPDDLLIGPHKVVGSAQRRPRGALMQHGGILLARSPFTPALPGIAELAGRALAPAEVAAAVAEHFARHTGSDLDPADWSDAERRRADDLAAVKYASDAWNRKR